MQEALTNTLRHAGCVPTTVRLRHAGQCLHVVVRNGPAGGAVPRRTARGTVAGHGLIGMRERVEALGGRLEAGPTDDGGFLLAETLPLREGAPA